MRKYKLAPGQWAAMHAAQDGRCALCYDPPPQGKRLVVDHDHRTGKVRALLCSRCNSALGMLRDDAVVASRVAEYLRVHGAWRATRQARLERARHRSRARGTEGDRLATRAV